MRTIYLLLLTTVLALASAGSALGQDLKMGYVNAARLLEEAPQAETATARLKEEFAPREEEIIRAQRELNDLEEQARRDADVMSESRLRSLERDILARKREVRRLQDEFRDDLNFRRNEEIGKLQQQVKEIIESMGKEENYDLILYEGIAYASPSVDLTDKILERLRRAGTAKSQGAANGRK